MWLVPLCDILIILAPPQRYWWSHLWIPLIIVVLKDSEFWMKFPKEVHQKKHRCCLFVNRLPCKKKWSSSIVEVMSQKPSLSSISQWVILVSRQCEAQRWQNIFLLLQATFVWKLVHCWTRLFVGMSWDDQSKELMMISTKIIWKQGYIKSLCEEYSFL